MVDVFEDYAALDLADRQSPRPRGRQAVVVRRRRFFEPRTSIMMFGSAQPRRGCFDCNPTISTITRDTGKSMH